jgi:hypothetical protein
MYQSIATSNGDLELRVLVNEHAAPALRLTDSQDHLQGYSGPPEYLCRDSTMPVSYSRWI